MTRSVTDDDLQRWFTALYAAFNARDVPALLAAIAPDVVWPNGWEGGIAHLLHQREPEDDVAMLAARLT